VAVEREAPVPAAAPPAAAPEAAGAPLATDAVLSLQRTAGNQAVCRGIASGVIARAPADVKSVTVTPSRFTVPLESGVSVKARADVADVTWALKDGTAKVSGSSIAADGAITIGGSQPGGTLEAEATPAAAGAAGWAQPFNVVEKPTTRASSLGSAAGTYEATFRHTFTGASGTGSGVERANINEKFDSLSVDTDFGKFTLQANAAGSGGWDLDAAGKMKGDDHVSIEKGMIDANKFVKTASNPSPAKTLPAGFTMTQHLHAKSLPSGKLDGSAFTDVDHVRELRDDGGKLKVVLAAGQEVAIDYAGPAVYRDAKADKTSVEASAPKPASGEWKRNSVQVSVTAEPSSAPVKYSITGNALGCAVDSSGKVLIGDTAGTITVRAGDGGSHYDEVVITITARPAPAQGAPKGTADAGSEPEPALAVP
jgi:hypothetical protein